MKRPYYNLIPATLDFIASFCAWILFFYNRKQLLHEEVEVIRISLFINASVIGLFWVALNTLVGSYTEVFDKTRIRELFKGFNNTLIGVVIIFFTLLLDDEGINEYHEYYKTFGAYFIIQFICTSVAKIIAFTYLREQISSGKISFNTLLVGSGNEARKVYDELHKRKDALGYSFISYLPTHSTVVDKCSDVLRKIGDIEQINTIIHRCHIERVIIALEKEEHEYLEKVLVSLEGEALKTNIIPENYQLILGSVKIKLLSNLPLLEINQDLIPVWQKALKRCIDIFAALVVLIIGLPFLSVIALLTKLSSKGPVFYKQVRIGKNGLPFNIIKFRSMYLDSEKLGPALANDKDSRITPWGKIMRKTRLDEFPQFYNVLKGDMSLVGPRPERQFFIDQIMQQAPYYKHLHKVRPGITSMGQVKYGYAENVDQMVDRLRYDILYIENMSLSLDFEIMLDTVLIMFQGRGK
ncbi:sugar transferase [uncultured Cytophaga sp.]|uniref:sugar transferase n=1 Tax=uncultured Cytophaga sp. TaxID=160238 RepID=UPI00261EE9DB|nr:sugar transferase [uncultured Cytophaga sp.]